MTDEERREALERYPKIHPDIGIHLVRSDKLRESARRHFERAEVLRELREELERSYRGRRFLLIRL